MRSATGSKPSSAKRWNEAQITIHVEPENKAKHSGIVVGVSGRAVVALRN